MLAGQDLVYVGLSDIPAAVGNSDPFIGQVHIQTGTFEEHSYSVNSSYRGLLLKDLVRPVPCEAVHMAKLLISV